MSGAQHAAWMASRKRSGQKLVAGVLEIMFRRPTESDGTVSGSMPIEI